MMWGLFFKKPPPHPRKTFKQLRNCSRKASATPTDSAQITRWNSATPNANVFVLTKTKTVICYTVDGQKVSKTDMINRSKSQIFEVTRKSLCFATRSAVQNDLRESK